MLHFIRLLAMMGILFVTAPGLAAESLPGAQPADNDRLDVSRTWSDSGGRVISQQAVEGHNVLHGVQLRVGENNWLKEYAVYNMGSLEQRTQFYPNGRVFLEQRREHNGDGSEVVYSPQRAVICQGEIRGDRRWSGSFLEAVHEAFAAQWMLREYREGNAVSSAVFPLAKLMLPADHADVEHWLWAVPDWPASGPVAAAATRAAEQGPQKGYWAYWLSGKKDHAEYQKLLVTRVPIAELIKRRQEIAPDDQPPPKGKLMAPLLEQIALTIDTYKRDSIWNDDLQPIKRLTGLGKIDEKAQTIEISDVPYHYDEAPLTDVVRILKEPRGKEPIHRIYRPLAGMDQTARALRLLLEEQMGGELSGARGT